VLLQPGKDANLRPFNTADSAAFRAAGLSRPGSAGWRCEGARLTRRHEGVAPDRRLREDGVLHKKRYERSRYLDENKQNIDKMPGEISDIYGKPTRFLQKKTALWRQFADSMQFFTGFFVHDSLPIRVRS